MRSKAKWCMEIGLSEPSIPACPDVASSFGPQGDTPDSARQLPKHTVTVTMENSSLLAPHG